MSADERAAKYETIVYASNRHAGLGTPVTVYASSKRDAVNRAVAIGWSGRSEDARVKVKSVEDVPPQRNLVPPAEEVWDEGFDAGSTWHQSGPSGIPNDPPANPYAGGRS
ncbi:hypothetical protein SEA_TWISTER6_7 [Gordonia phage Twister6]|uniref:Uncharacterized protein n=1 Tax=Gordonia phage Twister6 TaxID=1887655 RepID=A0A1B3B1N7_9CAUD|nr:hypothetical protein BI083_gp07 [Gordonia phage Twister6]AOE44916.1 hypothetical protein SEA_TWISTER6_7 [Gordonia phage Twister6]